MSSDKLDLVAPNVLAQKRVSPLVTRARDKDDQQVTMNHTSQANRNINNGLEDNDICDLIR
jgi:hypothetical protein